MDVVRLLPDSVANQIAAGEVIQRPASCLKELVENALDAGATRVQVIVRDAGRTLLQVVDNGSGMSETDARMAFERHATSKIRQASDIFSLHTMGFRGEALPSICAVSQVEMQTRTKENELGTLLEISGSEVQRQEPVQCPVGTNIRVRNLFFNVPARRKFLKSDQTELRNLLQEFYRIVLVYPNVQFTFASQDEVLFDLPASSPKQRIEALFGKSQRQNFTSSLVEMNADTQLVSISGFVGKPEDAGRTVHQYFFVNGRYMRHPYFHKAVMQAYEGMLQPSVQPSYFIYFNISPEAIDVNIHPTKTEIKFADEQLIFPVLLAAVREALGKFNVAPSLDFDVSGRVEMPIKTDVGVSRYNPFTDVQRSYVPQQWQSLYEGVRQSQPAYDASFSSVNNKTESTDSLPLELLDLETVRERVVQVAGKWIALSVADGLMLVHQHRAHACVLYSQMLQRLQHNGSERQSLLFPDIWDVNTEDMPIVEQMQDDLSALGFELERMSKFSFSLSAVPAVLPAGQAVGALQQMVAFVRETGMKARDKWRERMALSLAYSAALPSGRVLTAVELENLLKQLFALPSYQFTPDGKTVVKYISEQRLTQLF